MEQLELNPNSVNKLSESSSSVVDDDGPPVLSSQALAALKEFLAEQNHSVADSDVPTTGGDSKVALVSEDWRLSQFWYTAETAKTLAEEVITLCQGTDHSRVACIACPTLYAYLKKMHSNVPLQLLEYDKRFEQYGGDYTYYDYNKPEELPSGLRNAFKVVVADPPYLSKECLEKVVETISFLKQPREPYLLLLTGEVQKERAAEVLGLYPCGFRPQHSSKLGNEFRLFTNYDPGTRLGGWEK
ncbi:hypothetical protein QN277_013224 [Acacia crassicarpa]|uniref:Protein-lysine N-methyltransferase QN277_013224 n=1 Tax=Acacia crassicarpa TaxID=499986 RepID=A0AAE1N2B6_9FABA|nr:hypothetical protein QN277_013224 [Acacia crassicarpa]